MFPKRLVRLVLPALSILTGCHSQQIGNLTPDQQIAADQTQLNSAIESDRAGIIFAQKTLELAQEQQHPASAVQLNAQTVEQANVDLYIAQTMLHLDDDRQTVMTDLVNWRTFAKKLETQRTANDSH